jgi:hypothetical protein
VGALWKSVSGWCVCRRGSVGAWRARGGREGECECAVECERAVCEFEWGVQWESVRMARAGWKRESVRARWSVECGRDVGESECE